VRPISERTAILIADAVGFTARMIDAVAGAEIKLNRAHGSGQAQLSDAHADQFAAMDALEPAGEKLANHRPGRWAPMLNYARAGSAAKCARHAHNELRHENQ
jgi:hypothetical protein